MQKFDFTGLTLRKDYLWKIVNGIKFYSFTLGGFKLNVTLDHGCKSLIAVYAGPFFKVVCGGETFTAGIPKNVDENTATFLNSEPFAGHFNILDPDETASENSDSSCCS